MSNAERVSEEGLTEEQLRAVRYDGAVFLSSCPGAGKTTTAARMFVRKLDKCVKSNKWAGVALLSYTNTAVKEFSIRVAKMGCIPIQNRGYIGTIDSFLEQFVISPFYSLFPGWSARPTLVEYSQIHPHDDEYVRVELQNGKVVKVSPLEIDVHLKQSGCVFRSGKTKEEFSGNEIWSKIRAFVSRTRCYNHSQRRAVACWILKRYPQISAAIAARFPFFIVDEVQDADPVVLKILDLIGNSGRRVEFAFLGDLAQSIYGFNYVDTEVLRNCVEMWNMRELQLTRTFRMKAEIVDFVNGLFHTAIDTNEGEGAMVRFLPASRYLPSARRSIIQELGLTDADAVDVHRNAFKTELSKRMQRLLSCVIALQRDNDASCAYRLLVSIMRDEALSEGGEIDFSGKERLFWKALFDGAVPPLAEIESNGVTGLKTVLQDLSLNVANKRFGFAWVKRTTSNQEEWASIVRKFCDANRWRTIHSVKGETIPLVFVHGKKSFWNTVVSELNRSSTTEVSCMNEEVRIAYVAVTRARYGVILILPDEHLEKYRFFWERYCMEYHENIAL